MAGGAAGSLGTSKQEAGPVLSTSAHAPESSRKGCLELSRRKRALGWKGEGLLFQISSTSLSIIKRLLKAGGYSFSRGPISSKPNISSLNWVRRQFCGWVSWHSLGQGWAKRESLLWEFRVMERTLPPGGAHQLCWWVGRSQTKCQRPGWLVGLESPRMQTQPVVSALRGHCPGRLSVPMPAA